MALIADSAIRAAVEAEPGLVIFPCRCRVSDYVLRKKPGIQAELDFIDDIRAGVFPLEACTPADLVRSRALIETCRNPDLGLADACVISSAERLGRLRILTWTSGIFGLSGRPAASR